MHHLSSGDGNFKKVSVYTSVSDQLTHPRGGEGIFGKVTSLFSFPIHTYEYAQCTFIGTLFLLVHFINQLFIYCSLNVFHFSSSKQLLLEAELHYVDLVNCSFTSISQPVHLDM